MHLWGVPAIAPSRYQRFKLALDHKLRRDLYANCLVRFSRENLHAMVEKIRREKPHVMAGYAQGDRQTIARYVNSEGLRTWGTIQVVYGAERLWPHDSADNRASVRPRGVRDVRFAASSCCSPPECEAHDGLHESVENLIVEAARVRVRRPRAARGAPRRAGAKVAVTDLHNPRVPVHPLTYG